MSDKDSPLWRAAPVIFVVLWAGGYSFAKLGLPYIEPLTMLVIRFALATLILAGLLVVVRVPWPRTPGHWGALALSGLLIQSAYFGFGYQAMSAGVNAGTMAIMMAVQPLLVALLSLWLAPEDRGGVRLWAGLILGFGGVVIVIAAGKSLGPSPGFGLGMAALALAAITAATLFEKKMAYVTHPLVSSLMQYVVGFASLLPFALWLETGRIEWAPGLIIAMAYLVLGNSLIAVSLFIGMVRRGNATRISALLYLVPPLALIIAWAILGETLTPLAMLGFALCVVGVHQVNRATAKG
ncbi:DMT family transporter [Rhodalgimonas zhirmunskyi]|uniref:DMT family transporter n=1 Tax=Rhodalgimonas zhirmunskyi TaxID=2964767 RepID=A0AAJ1U7Y3_9RHOB|nr:DMT family transporter [Rhodoalgimonas zhirmunskyi]MDQ2094619.1 DMT family transporter [Rhodoalgimonas zhirmunskyi]